MYAPSHELIMSGEVWHVMTCFKLIFCHHSIILCARIECHQESGLNQEGAEPPAAAADDEDEDVCKSLDPVFNSCECVRDNGPPLCDNHLSATTIHHHIRVSVQLEYTFKCLKRRVAFQGEMTWRTWNWTVLK